MLVILVFGILNRFYKGKRENMETFGTLGFSFGIVSLARVITLEKKIKESGILKEKISNNKKE